MAIPSSHNKKSVRILILTLSFSFLGTFGFRVQTASACFIQDLWGNGTLCAIFQIDYEKIRDSIEGAAVGAARSAMAKLMQQQIYLTIGGGRGGQPMFITNFRTAIITDPQQMARQTMNDFLLSRTGGRGSRLNYIPLDQIGNSVGQFFGSLGKDPNIIGRYTDGRPIYAPGTGPGAGTNGSTYKYNGYNGTDSNEGWKYTKVETPRQASAGNTANPTGKELPLVAGMITNGTGQNITIANTSFKDFPKTGIPGKPYSTGIDQIGGELPIVDPASIGQGAQFYVDSPACQVTIQDAPKNARALLSAITSNPCNTPIGLGLKAAEVYAQAVVENQDVARTKAISPGVSSPTDANGNISSPAISISSLIQTASQLQTSFAATTGKGLTEFLAGAATSITTAAINGAVKLGTGYAMSKVNGVLAQATGGRVGVGLGPASGGSSFGGSSRGATGGQASGDFMGPPTPPGTIQDNGRSIVPSQQMGPPVPQGTVTTSTGQSIVPAQQYPTIQ